MNREIINYCLQKGLLVDNEVVNLLSETSDIESVKIVIEKIRSYTKQKIITKSILNKNKQQVSDAISSLPDDLQEKLQGLKIKLGISIEISKDDCLEESDFESNNQEKELIKENKVKILSNPIFPNKKLEVADFVKYFRNRFNDMKGVLLEHSELNNLTSIDKINGNKKGISIIGLVSDKQVTKNKNIIIEVEDLTGKTKVLINQNKPDLIEKAEDIVLDSVIGFKVSGSKEILFANDIVFPDIVLPEKKNSLIDESALFIGDLHFGSTRFMEKNFLKFVDYLNGKVPGTEQEVSKIKYLFIVGDLVAGVGNYPNQEDELIISDLEEQFAKAAELLAKIPKHIQIIISPGNHDGIRIMEPQPMFDEKFAWALYDLPNVTITTNPSEVNVGAVSGFDGFNILMYHGYSYFYYCNTNSKLILEKAQNNPEKVMQFLLKFRHLAPSHASTQYFPGDNDIHFIKNPPDILVSGHMHKSSVSYYNNILIISVSTWEEMSDYMEKVGAKPDFCKVPMFNLKTRAVKILDFE